MTTSKMWSAIAPVWYSTKMPIACIIDIKTNELFRGALKTYLDGSSENLCYKH